MKKVICGNDYVCAIIDKNTKMKRKKKTSDKYTDYYKTAHTDMVWPKQLNFVILTILFINKEYFFINVIYFVVEC